MGILEVCCLISKCLGITHYFVVSFVLTNILEMNLLLLVMWSSVFSVLENVPSALKKSNVILLLWGGIL